MTFWLMKSEPDTYSIDDLAKQPKKIDYWDGIRNYQARNFMRDEMKKGDLAFFYHSNCDEPGVVGIVEIVKEAYPDDTAFDPESKYYDPKSTLDNPRWIRVDVKLKETFTGTITLKEIKANPALKEMRLVQKGNRLSIMPVAAHEWKTILAMKD
ncbi:MAG: EVE domain-containing protein [Legionellales bacterium]|nr:EVE domain-containing protein [Legionellales bacterium]